MLQNHSCCYPREFYFHKEAQGGGFRHRTIQQSEGVHDNAEERIRWYMQGLSL